MKKSSIYSMAALGVVAVVVVAALLVYSPKGGSEDNTQATITVTDMWGRNVTVPNEVERIVCVNAAALRFICYMNGADRVVGVEEHEHGSTASDLGGRTYRIAHPEFSDLPIIGPIHGGDHELIAAVNPEVIFKCASQASDCDDLQNALGVPVVGLTYNVDLANMYDLFKQQLRLIGEVLDEENRAEELIDSVEDIMGDLNERTAGISDEDKLTAYVGGVSYSGYHGIDWTCAVYPPFDLTDANNVITLEMTMNKSVGQISIEMLPQLDPEVIFIDWGGLALCVEDYDKFKSALDTVTAFETDQIYGVLQYNWYATNWDSLLADCYYVGKILYPDAFADVDPEEKADEIFQTWVGVAIYDDVVANCGGGFQQVSLEG
ncbi:MAG: iron ABC transporter substrate-binding protein [Methanomassiliicoccales archaeon]|nr:iron ABC transporter substrate-binding protein [Methanomassiliicoccales archaeon]